MKKSKTVAKTRNELADEAIAHLNILLDKLKSRLREANFEIESWHKSLKSLTGYKEERDFNNEERALVEIAGFNIRKWNETKRELLNTEKTLLSLRKRAENSKKVFDVYEDTNFLLSKMKGEAKTIISNPDEEVQNIRKIVFEVEGHKELLQIR